MSRQRAEHWDIFCRIVDNFGDIGVCWRLSQQLANEHGLQVRLFIDDLSIASTIIQGLNDTQQSQTVNNIEICPWPAFNSVTKPANVVIETFGCELPDVYVQQMCAVQVPPEKIVWINLEYLSAEDWVSDFHAKPSRHPALALTRHFFFPGFKPDTGGLLRESNLVAERDAFLSSKTAQDDFWLKLSPNKLAIKDKVDSDSTSIKISLFCYPQPQINDLLLALANTKQPINLYLPFNGKIATYNEFLTDFRLVIGEELHSDNLTIHLIPFLSQADYDRLLWACDLNFVRGEDSWVRAIWASKPFIWQPYIQTDETHIKKLHAFLEAYTDNATAQVKSILYQAHLAWSQNTELDFQADVSPEKSAETEPWQHLIEHLSILQTYAMQRTNTYCAQPDLATKLVIFSENLLKNQV
ncbi:MAG: elongation factor P maturation arginine rhamnosyltransferase EarP [Pseudomonadota bacterium]